MKRSLPSSSSSSSTTTPQDFGKLSSKLVEPYSHSAKNMSPYSYGDAKRLFATFPRTIFVDTRHYFVPSTEYYLTDYDDEVCLDETVFNVYISSTRSLRLPLPEMLPRITTRAAKEMRSDILVARLVIMFERHGYERCPSVDVSSSMLAFRRRLE